MPRTGRRIGASDERVEGWVGLLLRTGVLLSAGVILLGGLLFLYQHGAQRPDYGTFRGATDGLVNVREIVQRAIQLDGAGVVQLGVILLVATPVARVALSVAVFAIGNDWTYVAITAVVLAILLLALARPAQAAAAAATSSAFSSPDPSRHLDASVCPSRSAACHRLRSSAP